MDIEVHDFAGFVAAARQQDDPQHLLFVFTQASLPKDATPLQKDEFAAGIGGEIEPLMSVDKTPDDIEDFDALAGQAAEFGPPWSLVFASAIGGRAGKAPAMAEVEAAIDEMISRIRAGWFRGMIPFDRSGRVVDLRAI